MSITQGELISRQMEKIRRLESALRLIRTILGGHVDGDAIDSVRLVCEHTLEGKE